MPFTLDYRPQTFADTVGQDHIKTVLQQHISKHSVKANYLFFGPRGTGKTTTARIMAKALNCTNLQENNPCNKCDNCLIINEGKTLDFVEIDAASHTGVDNIREEIIDKALYPPTSLTHKVYIIDEVHMLSKGAFNALLKIMEEPPTYITFILATTEIHKIPDTIVSRCHNFPFRHLSIADSSARLVYIAQQENIVANTDALELISKTAEGIMRDAVKYLEQVSSLGDVTIDTVRSQLGVVGDEELAQLLTTLDKNDFDGSIELLGQAQESGIDLHTFAAQMLGYIDAFFLTKPVTMTSYAHLFSEIHRGLRQNPRALLVYKIEISQFLSDQVNHPASINKIGQEKSSSKTKNKVNSTINTTQNIVAPSKQIEVIEKVKKTEKIENTIIATNANMNGGLDEATLKQHFATILDTSALSLVEKYIVVKEITDSSISLIAINKMADISLRKKTTDIEKQLFSITGVMRSVSLHFMTKEDYFASL